jgi:hypothetical protein
MRHPLSFEMKEDTQCYGDILKVAYFECGKVPMGWPTLGAPQHCQMRCLLHKKELCYRHLISH